MRDRLPVGLLYRCVVSFGWNDVQRLVVAIMMVVMAVTGPAKAGAAGGGLEEYLPGYRVARCLFSEGRLVIEHEGRYLVLREGDVVPGRPQTKVALIRDDEAVLVEGRVSAGSTGGPVAVPRRMIRITEDEAGQVEILLSSSRAESELQAIGALQLPVVVVGGVGREEAIPSADRDRASPSAERPRQQRDSNR